MFTYRRNYHVFNVSKSSSNEENYKRTNRRQKEKDESTAVYNETIFDRHQRQQRQYIAEQIMVWKTQTMIEELSFETFSTL